MAESLKEKTLKGVAWSGIDNVSQMGITFLASIVLARLLSPDDYGLLGIITIFTAICNTLINAGFNSALIRKKDCTDDDYNTVFICNLIFSLILYAVIFICAPLIANFFNRVELITLTQVSSLSMVIGALAIVQQTRITKSVDFKTLTKTTMISTVSGGALGIVMALMGSGVWALVAQQIVTQSLRTVFLFKYNKWLPKIHFNSTSFHELFGFGWKLMVSGLLDTIWKEIYQLVVGKFYSPATLGQYTRSNQFSQLFSSNLTGVIQRVTFPVLSNIQDDNERMVLAYRRIIKLTMFVTAISMFFLGAISEPLLYCLIGAKWREAAMYLPLICITGSFYPLHALNLNILAVKGRSDLFLGLEIVKKIISLGPLFIGATIGIIPMLFACIITCIISYFLNSYFPGKLIGYNTWMQIKDFALSYIVATVIAFSVYFLKFLSLTFWIILPIQIFAGLILFYILTHRMDEYQELKGIISSFIYKLKR